MNTNVQRMVEIASAWEDIRGRGRHGCDKAEGYTMFDMLDELRDLIRAEQDRGTEGWTTVSIGGGK